jgi:hypothetical protein
MECQALNLNYPVTLIDILDARSIFIKQYINLKEYNHTAKIFTSKSKIE